MIMQTIDFSDRIAMERAEKTEILIFHGELPEENSIKQAAMAFFRATGIDVYKRQFYYHAQE